MAAFLDILALSSCLIVMGCCQSQETATLLQGGTVADPVLFKPKSKPVKDMTQSSSNRGSSSSSDDYHYSIQRTGTMQTSPSNSSSTSDNFETRPSSTSPSMGTFPIRRHGSPIALPTSNNQTLESRAYEAFTNAASSSSTNKKTAKASPTNDILRQAFTHFDKGAKGYITSGNLRAVLGTENNIYINYLIQEADKDKDGIIKFEEFCHVLNRWKQGEVQAANVPHSALSPENRASIAKENVSKDRRSSLGSTQKVYRSKYEQAVLRANQRYETMDVSFVSSPESK